MTRAIHENGRIMLCVMYCSVILPEALRGHQFMDDNRIKSNRIRSSKLAHFPQCRPYLTMEFLLEPPQDPRSSVTSRLAADLFDPDRLSRPDIDGNDGAVVASGEGFRDVGRGRTLGGLPEAVQEQLLLDDLLSALMGFPGR